MILTHDDLSAIEASLGPDKAAPIINAFEKLEREQKFEVKKDLLMELATKADLAELKAALQAEIADLRNSTQADYASLKSEMQEVRGDVKRLETELKGDIKRLEMFLKVLIGLVVVAMGFFSPVGVELIKLLK